MTHGGQQAGRPRDFPRRRRGGQQALEQGLGIGSDRAEPICKVFWGNGIHNSYC
jgi:hypothetical protein